MLKVDVGDRHRRTEAFGDALRARQAVFHLVERLTGTPLPENKAEREKLVFPICFTESQAMSVATRLGFGQCGVEGDAVDDEAVELRARTRVVGTKRPALGDNAIAQQLLKQGRNGVHYFTFEFPHPVGFQEYGELTFRFRTDHPHVTFQTQNSILAIRWVLDELAAEVRSQRATQRESGVSGPSSSSNSGSGRSTRSAPPFGRFIAKVSCGRK